MQVLFESRDVDAVPLRDLAIDRVRFSMRRLTWLVPRAKVRFSDINGPRGGLDKCCQIELKTEHHGTLVIRSVAHDWRQALDDALARATHCLLRTWRRTQTRQRAPSQRHRISAV
ncbi:MAG: HPF/RaiA family ribosome-associated protein [Rubrivivax sp.]|nr:HPF/RaiA family ribosome-associated protein [Rubrivivax sp.]